MLHFQSIHCLQLARCTVYAVYMYMYVHSLVLLLLSWINSSSECTWQGIAREMMETTPTTLAVHSFTLRAACDRVQLRQPTA